MDAWSGNPESAERRRQMQESMDNLVEYGKQLDKDRAKRLRSESDSSSTTIDAAPSQSLPGAEPERKRKREDDEEDEDEDEDGEEIKQEWPPRTTTTPTTPPSELESGPRAVEKCWRCPEMFYVPVLDTDPRHMRKCVGWHHPGTLKTLGEIIDAAGDKDEAARAAFLQSVQRDATDMMYTCCLKPEPFGPCKSYRGPHEVREEPQEMASKPEDC